MAEQLRMPLDGGLRGADAEDGGPAGRRPRRAGQPGTDQTAANHPAAEHRRRRPPANRPVRGEPDVPESAPRRGDWRIDQRTRLAGLRGIARARAALVATGPDGPEPGQVDAA